MMYKESSTQTRQPRLRSWLQGPFTFELVGQGLGVRLSANPHAWSKVANMIFLDSPAGG